MMVATTSDKGLGVRYSLINSLPYKITDGRRNLKIGNLTYRSRLKKEYLPGSTKCGSEFSFCRQLGNSEPGDRTTLSF